MVCTSLLADFLFIGAGAILAMNNQTSSFLFYGGVELAILSVVQCTFSLGVMRLPSSKFRVKSKSHINDSQHNSARYAVKPQSDSHIEIQNSLIEADAPNPQKRNDTHSQIKSRFDDDRQQHSEQLILHIPEQLDNPPQKISESRAQQNQQIQFHIQDLPEVQVAEGQAQNGNNIEKEEQSKSVQIEPKTVSEKQKFVPPEAAEVLRRAQSSDLIAAQEPNPNLDEIQYKSEFQMPKDVLIVEKKNIRNAIDKGIFRHNVKSIIENMEKEEEESAMDEAAKHNEFRKRKLANGNQIPDILGEQGRGQDEIDAEDEDFVVKDAEDPNIIMDPQEDNSQRAQNPQTPPEISQRIQSQSDIGGQKQNFLSVNSESQERDEQLISYQDVNEGKVNKEDKGLKVVFLDDDAVSVKSKGRKYKKLKEPSVMMSLQRQDSLGSLQDFREQEPERLQTAFSKKGPKRKNSVDSEQMDFDDDLQLDKRNSLETKTISKNKAANSIIKKTKDLSEQKQLLQNRLKNRTIERVQDVNDTIVLDQPYRTLDSKRSDQLEVISNLESIITVDEKDYNDKGRTVDHHHQPQRNYKMRYNHLDEDVNQDVTKPSQLFRQRPNIPLPRRAPSTILSQHTEVKNSLGMTGRQSMAYSNNKPKQPFS